MSEPTLTEIFGSQASQNLNSLIISKMDLEDVGLPPVTANKPEQILAALILLFAENLTESARTADPENRNITIYYGGQDITGSTTSPAGTFLRDAYSVLLYRPYSLQPPDPSDY